MIGGAVITAVATVLFGFTRPVAGMFSEEGSGLVSTSEVHLIDDSNLIAYAVQDHIDMARHTRHLRHGLLDKCRQVSWGSRGIPSTQAFSLQQIVQAVDRALIVDVLPTGLQPAGNAWAATMLGAGSVFGFFVFVPICPVFFLSPNDGSQGEYRPSTPLPWVRRNAARGPGHIHQLLPSLNTRHHCLVCKGRALR